MAYTVLPLGLAGVLKIIRNASLTATPDKNVCDAAATVYGVTVDNSANAALTYIALYNSAAPTVGTTDPDMLLMIPVSARKQVFFKTGSSFNVAVSAAAKTTAGTAGNTAPSSAVITDILTG